MIGYGEARLGMIESQLRPNQVTDRGLLAVMGSLPRELFVPEAKRGFAYLDASLEVLPSRDGAAPRFLLPPVVQARLIQLAEIEPSDAALDIGCATGYSTAVLAGLASRVTGLEAEAELVTAARSALRELGIANAFVVSGELAKGAPEGSPYDVIVVNGSVPEVPEILFDQLRDGGRLVAVVARGRQGKAYRFVKVGGEVSGVPHFDANAKPLPGFAPASCFTF
jgi:protein-L-isoaspartate(D-aspartate) O-methyltransferase